MNADDGDDAVSKQHRRNSFFGQTSERSKISVHHNREPARVDQSAGLKRPRDISSSDAETCSPATQNRSSLVNNAGDKVNSHAEYFNKLFDKHTSPKSASKHTSVVAGDGGARRLHYTNKLHSSPEIGAKTFKPKTFHVAETSRTDDCLGNRLMSHVNGTLTQSKIDAGPQVISLDDVDSSDDELDRKKMATKASKALALSGESPSQNRTKNSLKSTQQNKSNEIICAIKKRKNGTTYGQPELANSFASVMSSIRNRKKHKTKFKSNESVPKKTQSTMNRNDVICLDDCSVDEENSDAHCQIQTAKNPKSPVQISSTSPTNKAETLKLPKRISSTSPNVNIRASRTLATIPSAENQPTTSNNISWQNKPPGPDDPKCMTRNGFRWHWCELCNKKNSRWSTSHCTKDHTLGQFGYISQHKPKSKIDTQTGSSESFGTTNNGSNSDDPICLSSGDEGSIGLSHGHYASAISRVKKESAIQSSVKALSNNSDTVPIKTDLPSNSTLESSDKKRNRSPIIIEILDSDDDSMSLSKPIDENIDLDKNNTSNVEVNTTVTHAVNALLDVGSSKLVLHLASKKKNCDGQGRQSPLFDSNDDSSSTQNADLAVNNKYCADRGRKDMCLPCTITTEKVGGQGNQDAAQYRDSQNSSDAKDMQGEAIQILVSAEKELETRSHVPIKFAILDEDKVFATDFVFYTMRQYMCDMFNRMDGSPHIGFGCLKCTHCNKKTSVKRASAMISRLSIYWKHLNEECEKVPKHVKEALVCLREYDKEQRKADSNIVNRKVMEAVFGHMISAGTLMPEDRSDDEDFGADDQDNVCASESLRIDESVSGQDLPEMRVVEWCKTLDKDHYPTVTFTAWNEKIDCLFDFKMFVAPSRITNSGNGAFLQLLRARLRNPVEGDLMAARCPLLAHDETGREIKVFVGPTTVHDDAGPSSDHRYVEVNSLTFSSWHDGCGSIDIGSYGPFLPSDIKQEAHFALKNFLFDFEPQGWSYGFVSDSNEDLVLDITNDETGETHLRARENIPMHVNEVGHNSELKQNVTPLEPDQGIHYYVHPQNPMKVGEVIELLVDYGEIYEEVRERKGYGKSNLGSDNVVSQRVKRNQGERVKIEDIIVTQNLLENYELLLSLQDTIVAVLNATDNCLNQSFTSEDTTRRWNARFRIHWIETIFRHRCMAIRTQVDDFLCKTIFSILDMMKFPCDSSLFDMVMNNKILRPIAMNEYLEESVFLASRRHQLLHPLDPTMWCTFAREIVHDLGQDLILDIKTGVISDAGALKLVYKCAKNASREIKRLCMFPAEIERLSFEKTENKCIVKYLTNSSGTKNHASKFYLEECDSTGTAPSQFAVEDQQSKHWVRWTKAQGSAASIDQNWYLLWQVVRVVHVSVKQCLSFETSGYSLKTLCEHVGVDLRDAQAVLNMKMVEPYDEETFISCHWYKDSGVKKNRSKQRSRQSQPRGRAPKAISSIVRKYLDQKGGRQKSGFIPNASPNVVRNRESGGTFWKEEPGGDEFPKGWIIHIHKRQSGATGGRHIDRYWFTKGGKKLRSSKEIERFLLALKLSKGDEELAVRIFEGKVNAKML